MALACITKTYKYKNQTVSLKIEDGKVSFGFGGDYYTYEETLTVKRRLLDILDGEVEPAHYLHPNKEPEYIVCGYCLTTDKVEALLAVFNEVFLENEEVINQTMSEEYIDD